ncbi:DUF2695 domain-containing protein [Geodermatophilus sp. YIM 151500]|uniref:DUF2695 domain-containing protein n=1 Tax=Geodermatophilus sp. YIM 151500 TaxID=2984531 RepID=UPI0021E3B4FD|nr:DUF2695 domain-containing protein [Geodermatophilus sp. YIM 151500]MCV2489606.1 DUF2695 domain-containing protein [Geodermatophilus sp. YIM 151500]
MDIRTPDDREPRVTAPPTALPAPAVGECVLCYVDRMLERFGCDTTLRWACRWRDVRLPGATGLERRLGARGGFCDCEIFLNGWGLRPDLQVPGEDGEPIWPAPRPPCAGVGRRSSQGCANWEPRRRPRW